jgi:hypothetical protein
MDTETKRKLPAEVRHNLYFGGGHGEPVKFIGLNIYGEEDKNEHVHEWINKFGPFIPEYVATEDWSPQTIITDMLDFNEGAFEDGESERPSGELLSVLLDFMRHIRSIPSSHIGVRPELNPCGDSMDIVFRGKNKFLIMNIRENGEVGYFLDSYDGIGDNPTVDMLDGSLREAIITVCWDKKDI